MNLATCYSYKGHTLYTDGRLYKAGELVGTYKTEAAAKAQATIRSRASNNARAAEHHANLMAIWAKRTHLMNPATGSVDTAENWAADGWTKENAQLVEVEKGADGAWCAV